LVVDCLLYRTCGGVRFALFERFFRVRCVVLRFLKVTQFYHFPPTTQADKP
jgi:hypothetical protein